MTLANFNVGQLDTYCEPIKTDDGAKKAEEEMTFRVDVAVNV